MTGKCINNGAQQKWTDAQMLNALVRVQELTGCCSGPHYDQHRLPTEPVARAIISRFRSWNKAKIQAGLTIAIKRVAPRKRTCDEEALAPVPRFSYPCWKCGNTFKGLGRRRGNWHCDTCTAIINIQASGMGW